LLESANRIIGIEGGIRMSIVAAAASGRKRRRVAQALLPGDQQRADGRGIGHRRARHATEDGGRQHAHLARAAVEAADQGAEHADQRLAQLAAHHQRAGEHEEGDGDEREALHLGHHLLHQQVQRNAVRGGGRGHRGHQQGMGDRHRGHRGHAEHHQDQSSHEGAPVQAMCTPGTSGTA
jgi:hypothetical protein